MHPIEAGANVATAFLKREGIVAWYVIVQTVITVVAIVGIWLLLLEIKQRNDMQFDSQAQFYQQIITLTENSLQNEREARESLLTLESLSIQSRRDAADALSNLSGLVRELRGQIDRKP